MADTTGLPRLTGCCPSCGTRMDAVPADHVLTIEGGRKYERDAPARAVAVCNYGDPLEVDDQNALIAAIRG